MTTAKDLAISFALAGYAKDLSAPAVVTISSQKLVKVERPKAVKAGKAPKVKADLTVEPVAKLPSPNGAVPTLKLPPVGSLGAKGFISMMNRAKSRDEKICAIAAFVGYDLAGDFAPQEMAATAKAKAEICPVKVTEKPSVSHSVAGYVAGMPDNQRKIILDLVGRENLAVSSRNDYIRDAANEKLTAVERELATGLAALEDDRLVQIRADLARLTG